MPQMCRISAAIFGGKDAAGKRHICGSDKLDKQEKSNHHRDIMQGTPGGDACRAHDVVRTRSRAERDVPSVGRCSAHVSVRSCALQRPLVRTTGSSRAHELHYL